MDITLLDKATGGSTEILLPVAEDENGLPRWREFRAPRIPPRISQGPLQWSHLDPEVDYVWSMDDWSDGALKVYYRDGDRRYATADNVDLRWEGVAALSMDMSEPTGWLLKNPGAEGNNTTSWTQGGCTLAADNAGGAANSGNYGFKMTTDGARGANTALMSQSFVNPSVYSSRDIIVGVRLRRAAGAESGVYIQIEETSDAGGTTSSGAHSTSTYTYKATAKRTLSTNVSALTVSIETSAGETGAHTYHADDFVVEIEAVTPTCTGTAEYAGYLYGTFGQVICKWDGTNGWDAVSIHASALATDIVTFGTNVYVAFGIGNAYMYGSSTSWVASTLTDNEAQYFAAARNASGAHALWKNPATTTIQNSTNPINAGTQFTPVAASALNVGTAESVITDIYGTFDTIVVAKDDGLWVYNRWDPNTSIADDLFLNVTSEWSGSPQSTNFQAGREWFGWLYMPVQPGSLMRWRPGDVQTLGGLFFAPRAAAIGGNVSLIGGDPTQLWLVVSGVGSPRERFLMSLRFVGDEPKLHAMSDLGAATAVDHITVFGTKLIYVARIADTDLGTNVYKGYSWTLPTDSVAPYADTTPALENISSDLYTTPHLRTSIWHGGMPDTPKAFLALTVVGDDLDATHHIRVKYGLDGAAPGVTQTDVLTFNADLETQYFHTVTTPETKAVGRMIQLEFEFMSLSGTVSPKMYAFGLHSTLRPERLRTWEIYVRLQNEGRLGTGYRGTIDRATLKGSLETLEAQTYPILMQERLGRDDRDSTAAVATTVHLLDVMREPEQGGSEICRLLLQEANTS